MVRLLSNLRECIDLANGLAGFAGRSRKKAKKEADTLQVRLFSWHMSFMIVWKLFCVVMKDDV